MCWWWTARTECQPLTDARHFRGQIIDHPLERVETEGLADGSAKIGVGVDVVEDQATVRGFQILDAADVESAARP